MLQEVLSKRQDFLVLCGLLSPCKTLRNFLSPPTAEYGNPAVSGHFCNYSHSQLKGPFFHTTPFCSETFFALENVSFVVGCPTEPPSLLSLCRPAVLQLKLQQRRTREELVSQGIMPRKCLSLVLSAFDRVVFSTWLALPSMPWEGSNKTRAADFFCHPLSCAFPGSRTVSH